MLADHPLLVKNGRELRLVVDDEEEADEEINEQAERIANLKAGQQGAVDAAIGKNVKKLLTGLRDGRSYVCATSFDERTIANE